MLGKPKFKVGDQVSFLWVPKFPKITGEVYIVDKYGTFDDNSDVSYDILAIVPEWCKQLRAGEQCLFKHINERYVEKSD